MKEPILVVMAAGMGSRYGGFKQIDPVGDHGEFILDYSLFDAGQAGFRRVVFLIRHSFEKEFQERMESCLPEGWEVHYAFQELDALPAGYSAPEGREKPWGTGHAVLCCREWIDAPFCVVNADDYYGSQAFQLMYRYLSQVEESRPAPFAMVGYVLANTITENGSVARGICSVQGQMLTGLQERTRIEMHGDGIAFTEDGGQSWTPLDANSIVSMNFWGFTPAILEELSRRFPAFLERTAAENPLKGEYFLPSAVNRMLDEKTASVRVFSTDERWYGVTYPEDKPAVVTALGEMTRQGKYPSPLWKGR